MCCRQGQWQRKPTDAELPTRHGGLRHRNTRCARISEPDFAFLACANRDITKISVRRADGQQAADAGAGKGYGSRRVGSITDY